MSSERRKKDTFSCLTITDPSKLEAACFLNEKKKKKKKKKKL